MGLCGLQLKTIWEEKKEKAHQPYYTLRSKRCAKYTLSKKFFGEKLNTKKIFIYIYIYIYIYIFVYNFFYLIYACG